MDFFVLQYKAGSSAAELPQYPQGTLPIYRVSSLCCCASPVICFLHICLTCNNVLCDCGPELLFSNLPVCCLSVGCVRRTCLDRDAGQENEGVQALRNRMLFVCCSVWLVFFWLLVAMTGIGIAGPADHSAAVAPAEPH